MDYKVLFDRLFPGFFSDPDLRGLPAGAVFSELVLDLHTERPKDTLYELPEGIVFSEADGSAPAVLEAVRQTAEGWLPYFQAGSRVYCAMDGETVAAFCILTDWDLNLGLRIGGPGCVGTVPAYRRKGIGLELVRRATEKLGAEGFDLSWIHYTHLARWYQKLGYRTVLRWTGAGFEQQDSEADR